MMHIMKRNGGGVLAMALSMVFSGLLLTLALSSGVSVAESASERNDEGCLIGVERYDPSAESCVPIDPPPKDLKTAEITSANEKPVYLALGEAEPFDAPIITNPNPYYPPSVDSQGCTPGVTEWGVNASGELGCIPVTTGYEDGFGTPPSPTPSGGLITCGQPGSDPATCIPPGGGSGQNPAGSGQNPSSGGTSAGGSAVVNPLKSTTITGFLLAIIDILLIFALPVIIFFIIYAGFLFVTARGNESQITTARTALTWSVIGGVVILGARAIIDIIQNTVKSL